jgi:hypothetical protein
MAQMSSMCTQNLVYRLAYLGDSNPANTATWTIRAPVTTVAICVGTNHHRTFTPRGYPGFIGGTKKSNQRATVGRRYVHWQAIPGNYQLGEAHQREILRQ